MPRYLFDVEGLSGTESENSVKASVKGRDGVRSVTADHDQGTVEVDVDAAGDADSVAEAIEDAGYEVSGRSES